ncbi:MAG: alpha/beta fold hydrolase [Pseudomonadales bacterium]|jgi:alpha-beta hydrolase superfamily lysophospholipase|nr:alpha/beta fold hydrolase [Pseudomonadales bacterium]
MKFLLFKLPLACAFIAALLYLALGLALSHGKTLGPRHAPFPYPRFDFVRGTLQDYETYSRTYLRAGRLNAKDKATLDNLAPFLLEPDPGCPRASSGKWPRGVVLTHGLIDSPYSMRPLGEALRGHCLLVYGLLLPAHGSRPGALRDSSWREWAEAEHWAAQRVGEQVERVVLGGHSAGATLAVLEAERNPQVQALVLFAPAFGINDSARYAKFLAPLSLAFPAAAWFEVKPDSARYRYESFPFRAAAETWALIQATWQQTRAAPRNLPTFTVLSRPDNTVDADAALAFMAANTNAASHTLLYSQHPENEGAVAARVQVLPSADLTGGLLGISHLGLMTPPNHPEYGRDGAYRNCGHYPPPSAEYRDCKAGGRSFYGEATPENLVQGLIERSAFNPYYDAMLSELLAFFDRLD